jgi:hypothetical protein
MANGEIRQYRRVTDRWWMAFGLLLVAVLLRRLFRKELVELPSETGLFLALAIAMALVIMRRSRKKEGAGGSAIEDFARLDL